MKHFLTALLKRMPENAPAREWVEVVLEVEQNAEAESQARQKAQRERHDALRSAAAERRRQILNRP